MNDVWTDYAYDLPVGEPSRSKRVGNVVIENIPTNRHCRYFHSRHQIQEGYFLWDRGKEPTSGEFNAITSLLAEIEGVASILLTDAYTLMISKGHAFEWDEVEPRILAILQCFSE